jgi:hypothetical protein
MTSSELWVVFGNQPSMLGMLSADLFRLTRQRFGIRIVRGIVESA